MMRSQVVLVLISLLLQLTYGDNSWITPPGVNPNNPTWSDNAAWPLGSVQRVAWVTENANYTIQLWQHGIDPKGGGAEVIGTIYDSAVRGIDGADQHSFDWTVVSALQKQANTTTSSIFFLWLKPPTGVAGADFASALFNITKPSNTSSSSTANSTTSSNSATAVTASTTANPFPIEAPDRSDEGLSLGAKIGLGVGVGFGVLLLLVLGILSRRKAAARCKQPPSSQLYESGQCPSGAPPAYPEVTQYHEVYGKDARQRPQEMSAAPQRYELGQ